MLKRCVVFVCEKADFDQESITYIVSLITCNMTNSYFKDQQGYTLQKLAFSMGDICAGKGSDLILRVHEISIFDLLRAANLKHVVETAPFSGQH